MSMPTAQETQMPYFYSDSHIAGCICAIAGLGIHAVMEVTFFSWYAVAFIFYIIGSESFKKKDKTSSKLQRKQTPKVEEITSPKVIFKEINLSATMNEILLKNKDIFPNDVIDLLLNISEYIEKIEPRLATNSYLTAETHTVKKIVNEYLPETLVNYSKIEPEYAKHHAINGKTAQQMLLEQLTLLNQYLGKILKNLQEEDVKALIINGRFLKEKFTNSDDGFGI